MFATYWQRASNSLLLSPWVVDTFTLVAPTSLSRNFVLALHAATIN